MVQVSYPGVYVVEKSSGVRTITGVATSIAAFVDSFSRGPLDEAVQCLSYSDFEREFGGLQNNSEASYGVRQFFQNGGAEAWVVRVATVESGAPANDALAAFVDVDDTAGGGGTVMFRVVAGRRIRGAPAVNPGVWGNDVYVDVDYETSDPDQLFNITVSEVVTRNGRRTTLRTETFRNLTMAPTTPNNAIEVVNDGSRIVQLDRTGLAPIGTPTPRPAPTGTFGGALPIPVAIPASTTTTFTVDAGPSAPATATLEYPGTLTSYAELRPFLEAAIRNAVLPATATDAERALIAGATVTLIGRGTAASPHRFVVRGGRGGNAFSAGSTLTLAGTPAFASLGLTGTPNVQSYQLGGGQDGTVPVGAPALVGNQLAKTGLYALEDVSLFNILCLPRAADLGATDMRAVYAEAETFCQSRRAFLVVDIPAGTTTLDGMQTWLAQNESLRNRSAAVYFPRTLVADPLNGNRLRSLAASGTLAGLYARTDATRGVWKAPAGVEARLQNVQGLAYNLTDLENGALNPLGVNCLRTFPVYGNVAWGARTLDGADQLASEWKYIPIMRLTLFIEESLYRGTQWVVFEPNDEPLWANIRLNVGVFMSGLFRQGAFQGATPNQAYYVKCDAETTTQADRNLGIVNIEVGFAPLKPAEFVVITIQQIAGDLQ
jgi:phage tail sheath protein FI